MINYFLTVIRLDFENIKNGIDMPEVYQTLKKDKLNDKLETEKLEERLIELEKFLQYPKCREIIHYEKCGIYI